MKAHWQLQRPDSKDVTRLSEALGCHEILSAVLINRGYDTPEIVQEFLEPSLHRIRSPFRLKGMRRAVSRIIEAIRTEQKILIFGDYDVDGVTATALLVNFFSTLPVDITYHLPDRLSEGYGLTERAVNRHAISKEVDLIITVDCGISSHSAVALAVRAGIDVIITDHHEAPPELPGAFAIINPKQKDCPSGYTWLAGVGVAFNLVLALRKQLRDSGYWEKNGEPNLKIACDLVALGTVADMAPLLEENRIFVTGGLEVLSSSPRPGLKAILDISGSQNGSVDAWDLAFRLAPRLNAAGRLGNAKASCELLITSDSDMARETAQVLEQLNNRRKEIEDRIFHIAVENLESQPQLIEPAIVMHHQDWHEGVIGIVASRLVNRYCRPVILIAEQEDGTGKGSARSPEGFDLYASLNACSDYLDRFGGHKSAAGLSLSTTKIHDFKKAFKKKVAQAIPTGMIKPKLLIDAELSSSDLTPSFINALEKLAPFGVGNAEPLFLLSGIDTISSRTVGNGHLKLKLSQRGKKRSQPIDAILFNAPSAAKDCDDFRHIIGHLRWNRWRGKKQRQFVIKDFD